MIVSAALLSTNTVMELQMWSDISISYIHLRITG
jgi:hypothetical protein